MGHDPPKDILLSRPSTADGNFLEDPGGDQRRITLLITGSSIHMKGLLNAVAGMFVAAVLVLCGTEPSQKIKRIGDPSLSRTML